MARAGKTRVVRHVQRSRAMKALLLGLVMLATAPRLAHADGWIHCSGPDSSCNASGADSASVGGGLLMIGAVGYGIARRKRR